MTQNLTEATVVDTTNDRVPIYSAASPSELRYMTPDNLIPDASATAKGKVELATTAETETGTDATRAVTPDSYRDAFATTEAAIVHAATEKTTPADADELGLIDSAASYVLKKLTWANLKATLLTWLRLSTTIIPTNAPQGFLINGKISVTDTGSGLTVAIKTLAGTDPSSTDPVYVRLNDAVRTISQAISVTCADGTNWFNAGSAELATKEIDYFVYLIWNSANSRVSIAFSRLPYYKNWGEVTDSNTNEKNFEYDSNFGSAVANDECEVVGRFAATLSAGAGYTWSVPTYTASNLIQRPIYETRWLSFASTLSGWSGTPTQIAQYKVMYNHVMVNFAVTAGVSNATTATGTLPFINGDASNLVIIPYRVADNSSVVAAPGSLQIDNNANTFSLRKDMATGSWTNTNNKLIYPTAPWNYKI